MPVSDPVLTTEAIYQERRKSVLAALTHLAAVMTLCAVAWPVFFHNQRHFFQGDTLYWLANRFRSMNDALRAFTHLEGGWYRPLTNATVESITFPLFGMSPLPYRLIGFVLFSATIGCVYLFQLRLAKSRVAALIACVFFTFHSVNAYVTYDAAFTPELVYTFFYVASTLLFVRSIRSGSRPALVASVTLFGVSLLCKEPAVTLPFTLVAIALFAKTPLPWPQRFWASVRPIRFHALVLAVYLVWTLGVLGLGSGALAHAFGHTNSEQLSEYQFDFDKTVLRNADTAMSLAFNLPRQWYSQSRLPRGMLLQLRVFRALMLVLLLGALIKGQIEPIAIGVIWFFVALAPALPLHSHFLAYYLFLPLVGFSLVVGTAFDFGYQLLRASVPSVSLPLLAAIFAQLVLVNARSVWNEQENNQLLGRSARIAQETVDTVRALKHSSGDQTIYFLNPNDGDLPWNHGLGALFALSFSDATMHAVYASDAESHPVSNVDVQHLIVLDYRHEVLTDVTQEALKGRELSEFYGPRLDTFSLFPKDVLAGAGSYTVSMPALSNRSIDVLYAVNSSAAQTFNSYLNNNGEVQFPVGPTTQRGIYRFLGLRSGGNSWLYIDDRLVVR